MEATAEYPVPPWRHPLWGWAFLWSAIACGLVFERQTGANWAFVLGLFGCTLPGYVAHQRALNVPCLAAGRDGHRNAHTLAGGVIVGMARAALAVAAVVLAAVPFAARLNALPAANVAETFKRLEAAAERDRAARGPGTSAYEPAPGVLAIKGQDGTLALLDDGGVALVYIPSGLQYRCVGIPRQGLPERCRADFPGGMR